MDTSGRNEFPPHGVAGRSLRDRVRSFGHSGGARSRAAAPSHRERSQLRWLGHLFRMPPGRLPREVFQACPTGRRPRGRKTQDTLEKLCLSAGLGTPRGPPGRAGGSVWGEGSLGISLCSDCCLRDPVPVPDQADEEEEDVTDTTDIIHNTTPTAAFNSCCHMCRFSREGPARCDQRYPENIGDIRADRRLNVIEPESNSTERDAFRETS
ncbi:hypothetical protein L3Q82_009215 [Scortum barcoo]|uniref:Uncharacterized protein n=1 Tax=Scortum barcoo TaxID=214431 RepID=A0ACB8WFQ3_9TELE|nr:hypothetical protein L3Q82_009215 [Scortum barcoo]